MISGPQDSLLSFTIFGSANESPSTDSTSQLLKDRDRDRTVRRSRSLDPGRNSRCSRSRSRSLPPRGSPILPPPAVAPGSGFLPLVNRFRCRGRGLCSDLCTENGSRTELPVLLDPAIRTELPVVHHPAIVHLSVVPDPSIRVAADVAVPVDLGHCHRAVLPFCRW